MCNALYVSNIYYIYMLSWAGGGVRFRVVWVRFRVVWVRVVRVRVVWVRVVRVSVVWVRVVPVGGRVVSERACRPPGRLGGAPAQRLPGEAA